MRRIAEVGIPPNVGDFRLMRRRVVANVVALDESHGFLRGLVGLVGFRQTAVLYDRDIRASGTSKYNQVFGSLRIGLNGIVGFSRYPLQVISLAGILFSLLAFLGAVGYGILRAVGYGFPAGGTIVILIMFFAGIQLLSLGVRGEYVGRIYDEVKPRSKSLLQSQIGFPPPAAITLPGLRPVRASSPARRPGSGRRTHPWSSRPRSAPGRGRAREIPVLFSSAVSGRSCARRVVLLPLPSPLSLEIHIIIEIHFYSRVFPCCHHIFCSNPTSARR